MRIEVDTQKDSKEELFHLANMLRALAGSEHKSVEVKTKNIFDDPSPAVGLMGMFGDTSSSSSPVASSSPSYSQPSEPQPSSGLFSIFSSSSSAPVSSSAYSDAVQQSGSDWPDEKTTAKDLIEDPRIVPY